MRKQKTPPPIDCVDPVNANRATYLGVVEHIKRLTEAGALAGRIHSQLAIRRDRLSSQHQKELDTFVLEATLLNEAAGWHQSNRVFGPWQRLDNWLFITCHVIADVDPVVLSQDEGGATSTTLDRMPPAPFEGEIKAVLTAITFPRDDVQALLKLSESDALFQIHRQEIAEALQKWLRDNLR